MIESEIKVEDIIEIYETGPEAVTSLINNLHFEHKIIVENLTTIIIELEEKVRSFEEKLNTNSLNSSKPPSTDNDAIKQLRTKSSRVKSGKKAGGQKGHTGTTLSMVPNPDITEIYEVKRCENCDKNLEDQKVDEYEIRQEFDIPPIKIIVTEHRAEIKRCSCGCKNIGKFPENIKSPVQYGNRVTSLAVYLHDYQLIPYKRSCELLSDVCGCDLSPASLIKAENICYEKLESFENEVKNLLHESPVVHFDETGYRINGQRNWLHVACTDLLTCYLPHPKRGYVAMDDMGILPGFKGTAVHDFWKSYFKYGCKHSLCNVHLTRELTGILENYDQKWVNGMKALLFEIKDKVDETRKISDKLESDIIRDFEERYDAMTKIGLEENPPPLISQDKPKKRGRKKQSRAKNLLDRFINFKGDILRFMYDFDVPFDNNQAERDVRMMKLQQKISGTLRSAHGADVFSRIRGFISTVKKNKVSVIDAIQNALSGKPFIPTLN